MKLDRTGLTPNTSIRIALDSGVVLNLTEKQARNSRFIWYQCTNCRQMTTLAEGKCGNCGSSFEPRDPRELATVKTVDWFIEKDWERIVFLLTHRAWVCSYCRCTNTNYPREWSTESVGCIHCGNKFTEWKDTLLPDGEIVEAGWNRAVESFKKRAQNVFWPKPWNAPIFQKIDENEKYQFNKSKWQIVAGIFGSGLLAWALYYGFIQEHNIEVTVAGQQWAREIDIEKYVAQQGEWWQEHTNSSSYQHFEIIWTVMREAPWDSYEVQVGTREVTDSSVCLNEQETCDKTEVTVSGWATVDWPEYCTTSCIQYGTKSEPVMETRYHMHPYIYFRYMDWKVVNTLTTSGDNTNVYWANTTDYRFDNKTIRIWNYRQSYMLDISWNEWQKETVTNIPYEMWKKLAPWTTCHATATRWWGIKDSKIDWERDCNQ